MRYLGNKQTLLSEIDSLIGSTKMSKDSSLCDLFSGTATVGNYFKDRVKIIANDNLYFSFVISHAKLNTPDLKFSKLEIDPFQHFNDITLKTHGFITENYTPAGKVGRMYFSSDNGQRIDYIRQTIESWYLNKKINENEYYYLIASLLESVSKVANIAGVYGAYLKIWDSRAVKDMKFVPVEMNKTKSVSKNLVYNEDVQSLVKKISGDILYLDPPYTNSQYARQYHMLETIALYDNPEITGITGARNTSHQSSEWCKQGPSHIAFEEIIAHAKFKHIILSYSSAGIMSKEYIEAVLKRHGKKDTYSFKKIPYKKYLNHHTETEGEHFEYLFYIEKELDSSKIVYESPLNYQGNKAPIAPFLKENAPKNVTKVADIFGGGLNAGINFNVDSILYNDYNHIVKQLLEMFKEEDTNSIYKYIVNTIKKYGLSKANGSAYNALREKYNSIKLEKRDLRMLYVLILFGFQQQIRFNSSYGFNNPIGNGSFNDKILEKIVSFSRVVRERNISFITGDYLEAEKYFNKNTLVYCDPPYLITLGSYNDGKRGFNGWDEKEEIRLLEFLSSLNQKGIKFMLSNVIEHKGKKNELLEKWIATNKYRMVEYKGDKSRGRKEVLVMNYDSSNSK